MNRFVFSAALVALVAAPALAQDVDATLAALAAAKGDAYVTARDQAIKSLKSEDLEAKLSGASWTDKNFASLAMATVVLAHQKDADTVAKVNHLDGLDQAWYSKTRINRPDVTRELRNLGPKTSGALLELHLKTFDRYPFSKDEAAATKEKIALHVGIVVQLAAVKHPGALFVAKELVNDKEQVVGIRNQAVCALGVVDTAEALAEVVRVHDDELTPHDLKLATLRAAGWSSRTEAFDLLMKDMDSGDATVRRQAAVALGTFSSPWGWDARGATAAASADGMRQQAAAKLVEALEKDTVPGQVIIEQIGVVAHASCKPLLEKAAANEKLTAAQRDTAKQALDRLAINLERNKKQLGK